MKSSSSGVGVLGVLQILFVVLKLLNLISWSWWLVLTPLWIDLAAIALVILVYLLT